MTRKPTLLGLPGGLRLGLFFSLFSGLLLAGCGPKFDPASLIETTRVVGARVEVEGAPDRATPRPGETADVTWLITSADAPSPLSWAFALCTPAAGGSSLHCGGAALAVFEGTTSPPRLSFPVPSADVLGTTTHVILYGEICMGSDSTPTFDPQTGIPTCTGGGGTTASLDVLLQRGDEANHNPVAEHAFTFDGQPWPALASGGDPCAAGPRAMAGTKDHVIGNTTAGSDRESYTALLGDPAVPTPTRERLQVSQFTTAGKLKVSPAGMVTRRLIHSAPFGARVDSGR